MARLFERIGSLLSRRPYVFLLVSGLLLLPALVGATRIEMETGLDTFVSPDTEMYREYEVYAENFATGESVMLMLSGDVSSVDTLHAEQRLGDALMNDSRVLSVQSMASVVEGAMRQTSGVAYVPYNQGELDAVIARFPDEVIGALLPDSQYSLILVDVKPGLDQDELATLLTRVADAAREASFPPGVTVDTTGEARFAAEMQDEMGKSLTFMLGAVVAAMILVLALVFSHVRRRLMPLVGVVVAVIATFGISGLLGVPLTMASMTVFPLLIGIGIDYFIQFHNRIDEEVRAGRTVAEAVKHGMKSIGPAVVLAVVCGGLGFSALFDSPVPMMVQFGGLSLVGIVLCFLAAVFFMSPLLYLIYRRPVSSVVQRHREALSPVVHKELGIERLLGRMSIFCARHPWPVIVAVVLLTVLGYSYDQHVGVSVDEESYAPPDMPVLVEAKKLATVTGAGDSLQLLIRSDDVTSLAVLVWMDEFEQYVVNRHQAINGSSSVAGVVKQATGGTIPQTSAELGVVLRSLDESVLERVVSGPSTGLITLSTAIMEPEDFQETLALLERDLEWIAPPPGTYATFTGESVLMGSVLDPLTSGRYEMTFKGLLLIFLALLIVYRDWFKALIPVLPVVMVTGLSGGVMYVLGMEYTAVSATMGALIIGLGVEYFLLVMTRYYEERDKGAEPEEAMQLAASRVGVALLSSGATTIGGFGALMLSTFPVLQTFGTVTVIIFSLLLLLTFTVLPAVLVPLDRLRSRVRHHRELKSLSVVTDTRGGLVA
ncbi:MAG: RND family transporter [Dehalococcoidia bacterium]|nr:RND family transporter [Dehalococcoidia bacterium]